MDDVSEAGTTRIFRAVELALEDDGLLGRAEFHRRLGYAFGRAGFPRCAPHDVSPPEWQAWLIGWDQQASDHSPDGGHMVVAP